MKKSLLLTVLLLAPLDALHAADAITVASDIEGASVRDVEIDEAARSICDTSRT